MRGPKVFISYSHKDAVWLERLKTALKPLLRESEILLWDDRQIQPGSKWKEEIRKALDDAKAAVLLVTQDFLASDFIHTHEFPVLLEGARARGLRVLWIPVKTSSYAGTPLAEYQALHDPSKPLDSLRAAARGRALVEIASALVRVLSEVEPPQCADSFEDNLERLLGFAYLYKGDGRTFFYHVDMLWIWIHAYKRYAEAVKEGHEFAGTPVERLLSFLPSRPDPETGTEVLDDDEIDALLDELVTRQYLTRSARAMGECFEITNAGRACFSRNRRRIEAKMDETGTLPGGRESGQS